MSLSEATARRIVLKELPAYAEEFPGPCACGACPRARKQTRLGEPEVNVCHHYSLLTAAVRATAWYRCGVCQNEHKKIALSTFEEGPCPSS